MVNEFLSGKMLATTAREESEWRGRESGERGGRRRQGETEDKLREDRRRSKDV